MTIYDRLAESPTPSDVLLKTFWGTPPQTDQWAEVVYKLASDLSGYPHSTHVLIHGRYGVGKTSFLLSLRECLRERARARGADEPPLLDLWLHMPMVTANSPASAASVIGAIVENLCGRPIVPSSGMDDLESVRSCAPDVEGFCAHLLDAFEELWNRTIESGPTVEATSEREPPRPTRLAGSEVRRASRTYRANTIEQLIEHRLGWCPDGTQGAQLVVYLDDVDRCHASVSREIVDLLLRFRANRAVRFVIACDRTLMEKGVADWMENNGTVADGHPLVNANSALEKYLDHMVELPDLGQHPMVPGTARFVAFDTRMVELLMTPVPGASGGGIEPLIPSVDKELSGRGPILGDFLLTWLMQDLEEADLLHRTREEEVDRPGLTLPQNLPENLPENLSSSEQEDLGPPKASDLGSTVLEPELEARVVEEFESIPTSDPETARKDRAHSVEQDDEPRAITDQHRYVITDQHRYVPEQSKDASILRKPLTALAEGLRKLCRIDPELRILRLVGRYRSLASVLTPRQLKAYLRARLFGTTSAEDNPESTLLQQVFPAFYELRQTEPVRFEYATKLAATTVKFRPPSGFQMQVFVRQLECLLEDSAVLTKERLRTAWPAKSKERLLLIYLLALIDWDGGAVAAVDSSTVGAIDGIVGGQDREFLAWVQQAAGVTPEGPTLQDQLSSYQDAVLAAFNRGDQGAALTVADYAGRFVTRHMPYLGERSATTLSNLAVLLNDLEPYEVECDRLFGFAIQLDPSESRIALYYAEFLLDVLGKSPRLQRLLGGDRYDSSADLMVLIEELLQSASRIGDPVNRFYLELLRLRLAGLQGMPQASVVDRIDEVTREHIPLLVTTAKNWDNEPFSRLVSALDEAVPAKQENAVALARVFGRVWGVLERVGAPTWGAISNIANSFIGQSRANSQEETLGLRMNLALMTDRDLIELNKRRVSAIWTQSILTWARRSAGKTPESRRRAALGMLASLVYGIDNQWVPRARILWDTLAGTGEPTSEGFIRTLQESGDVERLFGMLNALQEDPSSPEAIVEFVFEGDLGQPLHTVEELASEQAWPFWDELKREIDSDAERYLEQSSGGDGAPAELAEPEERDSEEETSNDN
ncbi:hypothetical protein [Engelhardtia mirabilis]|uniref:hypothetical protein n=1 Tax=Engelhardtia mirabilis TaxID=2528011 RepID=UPI0011AA0D09